ncbi:FdtA/QdtA family cupin domain-containing protein [Flavobacterium sp. MFBS3-15]|uniref:sugar 3,4-ketoisomerase n=1 Tax=Flavobacterium sp. MFBS3-15 TaxID=2989816 RepID=UPI00223677A5|nr:FdtA/QdtA family cupin domain-containing protein [Flavobacterium sp. MFBS3-15]MCW4468408.1 FdtA/QdtA family cupin domain-containing protein [Flavobacterium sp. MFBS3-15]
MYINLIDIPKVEDATGNVGIIEKSVVPFEIKRVFYLFDIAEGVTRGRHAHKKLLQFIIAISGSFDVVMKDGTSEERVNLNSPVKGLLIQNGIWSELENFSSGAVCMVIASEVYDEKDYIRDYSAFLEYVKSQS